MKTIYYLGEKKVTKKSLCEKYGEDYIKKITAEAKEDFKRDPFLELSYFLGTGMLTIEFE